MQVSNEVRRSVSVGLGPWMTDDPVPAGLHALQQGGGVVGVWADPVVLTACFQGHDVGALPQVALSEGQTMLGACVLGGHWVAFCWQKVAGFVFAWMSVAGNQLAEEVSHVHWMFAKRAAQGLGVFKFRDAASRELPPGLCGHAALLDLHAYLMRQAPVPDADIAAHATRAYYSHLQTLQVLELAACHGWLPDPRGHAGTGLD